ncbi:uncharacterized protein LOC120904087 [Anopheles arabiensis]|uniref:uncharacterized protein LOC120904087 n=1 Tax=Anopheles arabiensis TaxID=7173 RepID=UPI001AADCBFF|nr:uncharacterized protein LOC120904087 [Anopheles arabiensis]
MPVTPLPQPSKKGEHEDDVDEFAGFVDDVLSKTTLMQFDTARTKMQMVIEQLEDELNEFVTKPSASIVPAVKLRVNTMAEKYNGLQEQLYDSKNYTNEDKQRERKYNSLHRKLTNALEEAICEINNKPSPSITEVQPASVIVQQYPLPASLPSFNGNYEAWPKFKAMFLDIIKRSSDSDAVKIHHLDKALVGQAAGTLNAHLTTTITFDQAWKFVEARFDNPRVIVDELIKGLLNMPHVRSESAKELRSLLKMCTHYINGLKNMNKAPDTLSKLIINYLLTSRFDPETRKLWERTLPHHDFPDLDNTLSFLTTQCEVLERCKPESHYKGNKETRAHVAVPAQHTPVSSAFSACELCSERHWLDKCPVFIGLSVHEKINRVQQLARCENCLGKNHAANRCKSKYTCRKCKQRHHTLLHKEPVHPTTSTTISMQNTTTQPTVLLATAVVYVEDKTGKTHPARALLDSGSQSNFISSHLAQLLNIKKTSVEIPVIGIGGSIDSFVRSKVRTTIHSRCTNYKTTTELLVLKKPAANLPCNNVNFNQNLLPSAITLADPNFYCSGKIDIILGAEHFAEIIKGGRLKINDVLPSLQESELGWLVSGKVASTNVSTPIMSAVCITPIEQLMAKFFEVEELSATSSGWSEEETHCETSFLDSTTRDEQGRYVVRLPVKSDIAHALGDSKSMALRRFLSLERRLQREPETRAAYVQFMTEYEQLGHMSPVEHEIVSHQVEYYIPHHPVFKAESTTTKCRVVFDASAKTTSGYSLNDALMVGPTIQQESFTILLRFRSYIIAAIADVEKMYRQVWVHPEDRPLQRIFWRDSPNQPIRTFQLNTVTYGTASAPFLAVRALKQIIIDHGKEFPKAAERMDDFYVDDFISGADSITDVQQLYNEATTLLAKGGFTLRKWCSNDPEALIEIGNIKNVTMPADDVNGHVTTLGLIWRPRADTFSIKVHIPETIHHLSKRFVLSSIAKIYDPLGLIDPVKALAKQIMQQIWELKKTDGKNWDWDDELPSDLQQAWVHFQQHLEPLRNLQIPRAAVHTSIHNVQLHVFCDASEKGYGACCYIRDDNDEENITSQLLTSKSKIAPLSQKLTIAQLELCAAKLGSDLFAKVKEAIPTFSNVYFWTDSMIVYHWLQSPPQSWKTFVANRVSHIQKVTKGFSWRHIPGCDNPADLVSRGCFGSELINDIKWWQGPTWLPCSENVWPLTPTVQENVDAEQQRRSQPVLAHVAVEPPVHELFTKYSSLFTLRRMIGYWIQYYKILRKQIPPSKLLSVQSIIEADLYLCRLVQETHFKAELKALKAGLSVPSSSCMKWFNPIISSDGLIRVGGRLTHSILPETEKHPIILPSKHPYSVLLANYYHLKYFHAGPQHMLNTIRQQYWIIGGRNLVKRVYHQCLTCFRAKPKMLTTLMGDLPPPRVIASRPFSISGIDYCGPVFVKGAHRRAVPTKAFVAIFICFTTKAVHIELVSSLTTEAFLAALRRFIGRRGLVSELHSDNGTNFKGASNELNNLYRLLHSDEHQRKMHSWTLERGIDWTFIPPRAPHFGGLWESAVKSAKYHLLRTMGTSSYTFEDMMTILTEVEGCLNSRPITPMSDNPSDLTALTPGHFLTGSHMQLLPSIDVSQIPSNRLNHWQLIQQQLQRFWKRWHTEYLQQLQTRSKWFVKGNYEIREGQLVIVHEDNVPPSRWPLARITKIHPGKDGVTRVVTIRTSKEKELTRPITKICLIPEIDHIDPTDSKI